MFGHDSLATEALALWVNENKYDVPDLLALQSYLSVVPKQPFAEVHLSFNGGSSLSMVANGDQAWLMYLREAGDVGFSSRNKDFEGQSDALIVFKLSNGQVDEYPASWTISTDETLRALEYFFVHRKRPDWIKWHDDSLRDEDF